MNRQKIRGIMAVLALLWVNQIQALQVTVSIPPLAGLVQPLLAEDDRVQVLLKPGASPHGFQLKPSHIRTIQDSDLLLAVGTPVDGWLEKTLQRVQQPVLKMSELTGLHTLPIRSGGLWSKAHAAEDEGQHGAHGHGAHAHGHHGHDEHGHDEHGHDDHANWNYDGHIWLSVENASLFVKQSALLLKKLQPEQALAIEQREQAWLQKLQHTDQQIKAQLAPVKDLPYVVLHDAYQYFEARYQLNGVGSIRLNPEIAPSLKRVQQLRERIQRKQIRCLFKESQFPEKRVLAVVRGLEVGVGSLDPMGSFSGQPFLPYEQLLLNLANSIEKCLAAGN